MATTRLRVKSAPLSTPAVSPRLRPNASAARRVAAELAPLLALYVVYTLVRWLVADRGPIVGGRHAPALLDFERRLGLDWERAIQGALLDHGWLLKAANAYYVYGFFPILVGCAALGAWKAPSAFQWWRGVFSISLAIALIGFAVYPLAPPRLLPASYGFVDTLLLYGPRYYGDATGSSLFNLYGSIPSVVNVYAAMPSMHVAWSAVAGALFVAAMRRRWWAVALAIAHPTLMAFVVVATANHYVLDVVCGLAVLLLSICLARLWQRRRRLRPATTFAGG
jgi:PAP2 superfamily